MDLLNSFVYPDVPRDLWETVFSKQKQMIIVGVLGKSNEAHCNKLVEFGMLNIQPNLEDTAGNDGRVKFYFRTEGETLFLHFDSTFDNVVLLKMAEEMMNDKASQPSAHFITFNSAIRTRYARILLFALQFLPEMLRKAGVGSFMGKECRLASPRLIFLLSLPETLEKPTKEDIQALEVKLEDFITKTLRNEFIITNNSAMSLFSLPKGKKFVFYTQSNEQRKNPTRDMMMKLSAYLDKPGQTIMNSERDEALMNKLKPYEFIGFPDFKVEFHHSEKKRNSLTILDLVQVHVMDILEPVFDETFTSVKHRTKCGMALPSIGQWYDMFRFMYQVFIENPAEPSYNDYEPEYKSYLENFHTLVDIDEQFFSEVGAQGLELAMLTYKEMLPVHYSARYHQTKYLDALHLLGQYVRGPQLHPCVKKLKEYCDSIWMSGKQQCEYPSLRGNPCLMGKHQPLDPSEHSSGVIYVSSCNCGRIQGHREDPYTIRQANYEFYQCMAKSCSNCKRLDHFQFPIFEPSTSDFRAAEFINKNFSNLMTFDGTGRTASDVNNKNLYRPTQDSPYISSSERSQNSFANFSFNIVSYDGPGRTYDGTQTKEQNEELYERGFALNHKTSTKEIVDIESYNMDKIRTTCNSQNQDDKMTTKTSVTEPMAAIALEIGPTINAVKYPSTTEYLPGMLHAASPAGLLPRFPSWSLVCLGSSSIYTHNTGLPEHVQSGFLSGSNYLLPWDVNVRLEHAQSWAASYEKIRLRKKANPHSSKPFERNNLFTLKIFIGVEYECLRGHRFIMKSPDSILRSSAEIARDSGSNVVFNDMPIYFSCPCRNAINNTAQLMRVHIITPKAPVNVIIDPKVKIFQNNMQSSFTFNTGVTQSIKLTQSSYWILRLPFVYEGDTGALEPPAEVNTNSAIMHGVLMAGMYGIRENEPNEESLLGF
uniref:Nonsense-mediated mRNA decay factor SMG8 n=1 Tax=Anopheles darlingi TaxID=43151 RepID=A0A087ZGW7_ANODA